MLRTYWVVMIVAAAVLATILTVPQFESTSENSGTLVAQNNAQQAKKEKAEEEVAKVRKHLSELKWKLAEEGKYACCIRPMCDFCLLAANTCPCSMNAGTEKGVCGECYGGWQSGYGALDYVDERKVKPVMGEMANKMYDMRARNYGEAPAKRGQR